MYICIHCIRKHATHLLLYFITVNISDTLKCYKKFYKY